MTGAVALFLSGAEFSVFVNPPAVSNTGGGSTVVSVTVTASGENGSGSYSYQWIKQSGDSITAMDAFSASTQFQATLMAPEESRSADFRCRVTDIVSGIIKDSAVVPVTLTRDPV